MKRNLLSIALILIASFAQAQIGSGPIGGGGSGSGVQTDTDCNQAKYFPIGKLCQDTDDGKLYKGTGAAVVEIAAGAGSGDELSDGSVPFTGAPRPNPAGGVDLGTTAAEWRHLYLGAGGTIYGQADQSNSLISSATGWRSPLPLSLGTASSVLGQLIFFNNVNNNPFTIYPRATGVTVGWGLPIVMPTVNNSIMEEDTDGGIHFGPALGTMTNTYICKYTATGTIISCDLDPATFQAALTRPMTGPASPTTNNLVKFTGTGQGTDNAGIILGTMTDGKWCSYASSGTLLSCTENAPGAGGYTNLTSFVDQTAWRVFYSDGSGDVKELALGADGTYFRSNGATSAPTFGTPSGAGDMLKADETNTFGAGGATNSWTWNTTGTDVNLIFSSQNIKSNSPLQIHTGNGLHLTSATLTQPFTDVESDANTYYNQRAVSSSNGGFLSRGLSATDSVGNTIEGYIGVNDPTDTTPAVTVKGYKSNGSTGAQALGAGETVFTVQNSSTAVFSVLGDGIVNIPTGKTYNVNGSPHTHAYIPTTALDDTKGNGDTTFIWSADKTYDQLALKMVLDISTLPLTTASAMSTIIPVEIGSTTYKSTLQSIWNLFFGTTAADGSRGFTVAKNTSDCATPASGSLTLCPVGDVWYQKTSGTTLSRIAPPPSTALAIMDGSASYGTSTTYARDDHVHPSDTSRAATAHTRQDSATPVIDDPDNFAANFTGDNLYGGTFIANAAGTAALPNPAAGMNFTIVLETTGTVIIDPLGTGTADTIYMNGLAAAQDENITSATRGAMCVFQYRSADAWMATCNGFTEATPP